MRVRSGASVQPGAIGMQIMKSSCTVAPQRRVQDAMCRAFGALEQ